MAPRIPPDPETAAAPGPAPRRLDDPDPLVDPRFRLTVSVPPLSYVASKRSGWNGALLVEGDSGFVRSGEVRHEHQALVIQRWQTPHLARPIGDRGGWTRFPPGVRLLLPGTCESGEWCGRPRAQMLFLAPERVEGLLGTPLDRSGLTRWRDPRHPLPFVEHVISALMRDMEAGHPAGPLAGDALLVALLLHLATASAAAGTRAPRALGRGLDAVRDYIEENLTRALRLADLAAVAGADERRFGASFAAEAGCTPQQYVLSRRIERARALLRRPDLTLAQIARAVGFTGEAQLAAVFRRHLGVELGALRRH
jgi:AraC family transcriptional regulator